MWQETYVKWKSYWQTGTSEFSPISSNVEKFILVAIMLKVYVDNDVLLFTIAIPAIVLWNVAKIIIGWWRDRAMLWHYENEFINARNPMLKRIAKAVKADENIEEGLKHWSQQEEKK